MSPVQIKICGITRVEDALAAIDLGVAMLGVNFYPGSPRCITLQQAQGIAQAVTSVSGRTASGRPVPDAESGRVRLVGVFVNMNVAEVLRIARAVPLDAVQLHGDECPQDCAAVAPEFEVIRALKVDAGFSPERVAQFAFCRALLLDTACAGHGGSGKSFCWANVEWKSVRGALFAASALGNPAAKLFLAGGLYAGNVAEAIAAAHPDAVDVCSGVESAKGIKSLIEMGKFVAAVRAVESEER